MKFKAKKALKYKEYLKIKKILENNPEIKITKFNISPLEIMPHRVHLIVEFDVK